MLQKKLILLKQAHSSRIRLCLDIYQIIKGLLHEAALNGLNHLIIKEKNIVRDISKVVDILATQLFTSHNIYSILVTRG